jgi:ABC-2 type transport system ATP-binding protein
VIEQCGLKDVEKRIIGQLSKGYRQRVGLADALVHDPDLIILDEPTIGLDPHQLRSVRALIKELGRQHTVLLSTHILTEVEMTCSRVLILNQGRILAADRVEDLESRFSQDGRVVAEIDATPEAIREAFRDLPEVAALEIQAAAGAFQRVAFTPKSGQDLRPLVFEQVRQHDWSLRELTRPRLSLEDIFIQLTQKKKGGDL